MDKPALLSILEKDSALIDLAGAAMYKIREPKGSTRLSFQQISDGKKRRNRELAVSVISDVLRRYPDPGSVQSADVVENYLAEVMYRTLSPGKSESFPLDQRTPFAKSYYREKASSFFFDFLEPLSIQERKSALPRSVPIASVTKTSPASKAVGIKRSTKTKRTPNQSDQTKAIDRHSRAESAACVNAVQPPPKKWDQSQKPPTYAAPIRQMPASRPKPRMEVTNTVSRASIDIPQTSVQPATGSTWLLLYIALLLIFIIHLLL
jgi:hypothetical protein